MEDLRAAQRLCREVYVGEPVEKYVVALVRSSREHAGVELGASPRASLALYRASQALAAIRGRGFVIPDDVKSLALAVLGHRLITTAQARLRGRAVGEIVAEILAAVPVPVEDDGVTAQSAVSR